MSGRSRLDGWQCFPAVDFMQFGPNDPQPMGFPCHSQWTPSYFLNLVKANDMRKLSLLIGHFSLNLWHCSKKAIYYPVSSETFSYNKCSYSTKHRFTQWYYFILRLTLSSFYLCLSIRDRMMKLEAPRSSINRMTPQHTIKCVPTK